MCRHLYVFMRVPQTGRMCGTAGQVCGRKSHLPDVREARSEMSVSGREKVKTDFQCVYPTWEQIKNTRHIFRNMSDIF